MNFDITKSSSRGSGSKLWQLGIFFVAVIMVSSSVGYLIGADGPTGFGTVIEPGSMVEDAAYIIFEDSGSYYVKNGTTGGLDYVSLSARQSIQYAINQTPRDGGHWAAGNGGRILVRAGNYPLDDTLIIGDALSMETTGVSLIGEQKGTVFFTKDSPGWMVQLYNVWWCQISNIEFDGNYVASGINLTAVNGLNTCSRNTFSDLVFWQVYEGLHIYTGGTSYAYQNFVSDIFLCNQTKRTGYAFYVAGSYNQVEGIEGTQISGLAFYGTCSHGSYRHFAVDGPISDIGAGVYYEDIVFETYWTSVASNIGFRLAGYSAVVNGLTFTNCQQSHAEYGLCTFNGAYTIINLVSLGALDYPKYLFSPSSGSSGTIINCRGTSTVWAHLSATLMSNWTCVGGVLQKSSSVSVTGSVTSITVVHGLATTPNVVIVTGNSILIGNCTCTARTSTTFTISFENAPGAATWTFFYNAEV